MSGSWMSLFLARPRRLPIEIFTRVLCSVSRSLNAFSWLHLTSTSWLSKLFNFSTSSKFSAFKNFLSIENLFFCVSISSRRATIVPSIFCSVLFLSLTMLSYSNCPWPVAWIIFMAAASFISSSEVSWSACWPSMVYRRSSLAPSNSSYF